MRVVALVRLQVRAPAAEGSAGLTSKNLWKKALAAWKVGMFIGVNRQREDNCLKSLYVP